MVGYAKWQYPYSLTPEQRAEKARLDEADKLEHPLPEGSNRELHHVFFSALVEKRGQWMDESKDYCKCGSHKTKLVSVLVPLLASCGTVWPCCPGAVDLKLGCVCYSVVPLASPLTSFDDHVY